MRHHASRSSVIALTLVGLLVSALAALIAVTKQFSIQTLRATPLNSVAGHVEAYSTEQAIIKTYLTNAVAIESDLENHRIDASVAKTRALALTVPSVLKGKHLQWVLALQKGDLSAAADAVRDYRLLANTP